MPKPKGDVTQGGAHLFAAKFQFQAAGLTEKAVWDKIRRIFKDYRIKDKKGGKLEW